LSDWDDEDDEAVGYGKPPRSTRFQPGRSGNPRGRPMKSESKSIIAKALNQPVAVTVEGKRKTISAAEALIRQQMQKALAGDPACAKHIIQLLKDNERYKSLRGQGDGGDDDDDGPFQEISNYFISTNNTDVALLALGVDRTENLPSPVVELLLKHLPRREKTSDEWWRIERAMEQPADLARIRQKLGI